MPEILAKVSSLCSGCLDVWAAAHLSLQGVRDCWQYFPDGCHLPPASALRGQRCALHLRSLKGGLGRCRPHQEVYFLNLCCNWSCSNKSDLSAFDFVCFTCCHRCPSQFLLFLQTDQLHARRTRNQEGRRGARGILGGREEGQEGPALLLKPLPRPQ